MSDLIAFRPDWLALVQEPILEPELRICDAHHHLWEIPGHQYKLDEFYADLNSGPTTSGGHNVVSTVYVECTTSYDDVPETHMQYVGETRFIDRLAQDCLQRDDIPTEIAKAIIARADLDEPDTLPAAIEAHRAASPDRFRGFRHAVNWDSDPEIGVAHTNPRPGLLRDADFQRGAAILAENDLIFETVILHTQIGDLIQFAESVPQLKIVLDHMASIVGIGRFSGQREAVFRDWSEDMTKLAVCENITVKLGGLNMARHGFGWHTRPQPPSSDELVAATGRYYRHVIDLFGPERCMFESNFPMDKISCSYHVLWNAFKKMTVHLPTPDRERLFSGTAETLYQI